MRSVRFGRVLERLGENRLILGEGDGARQTKASGAVTEAESWRRKKEIKRGKVCCMRPRLKGILRKKLGMNLKVKLATVLQLTLVPYLHSLEITSMRRFGRGAMPGLP